ncbi:type II CRISPR-associated endonuclease Cas1 [Roseateles sp. BYS180W]|uniref:Type II CRISPR-associated endonuclease Cas1 n=1 Tax=Roseateles rivi TaxID=3299028 RepID=A0ABW7FT55_9BURK
MLGRIVEVADDHRHLSVHRGFLVVKDTQPGGRELGQVALDDIAALIANAHGLSYSNNLLVALAERGAPMVVCGPNHNAVSMLWPIDGHFEQARRIDAQLASKLPTHKRLWAAVVKSKLEQQGAALAATGAPDAPLKALASKVRSGDPDNLEAQGARRYWSLLFGAQFRRDQQGSGLNSLLNYGYTVLRAAMARAVIAAGLHPSLGLHHSHDNNAMRLVDDLMEPFRPLIDLKVWRLQKSGTDTLSPEVKRALVLTLYADLQTPAGTTPVMVCMQRLAVSLAQVYLGERDKLDLPPPPLPLDLAPLLGQEPF